MPKSTFLNLPEPKRARIVALAIEEFSERPYREASLSRLVARAGIAKGSMYQYFENKLDLYRWLLVEHLPARKLEYLTQGAPASGLFAQLEEMVLLGTRFMLENPRLGRLAASVLEPASDPGVREVHRELAARGLMGIRALVERAQARGEIRAELDPGVVAHLLRALVGHGMTDILLDRLGVDLHGLLMNPERARAFSEEEHRALARQVIDIARNGLMSATPAG